VCWKERKRLTTIQKQVKPCSQLMAKIND
jgi:hypothetical protein